jgi:hypothetical protein
MIGVFNEDMAKLANGYGKIAADGNAYLSTLTPDCAHGENNLPKWYTANENRTAFTADPIRDAQLSPSSFDCDDPASDTTVSYKMLDV